MVLNFCVTFWYNKYGNWTSYSKYPKISSTRLTEYLPVTDSCTDKSVYLSGQLSDQLLNLMVAKLSFSIVPPSPSEIADHVHSIEKLWEGIVFLM